MRSLVVTAMLALATVVSAETIVPVGGSLFADHGAHRVGDALTILIVESTQASKSTVTRTRADTQNDLSGGGHFDFLEFWNLDASNQSHGEGSTARRGDLQARITVLITQIDANGLLLVEGSRSVKVNGEEERIVITGAVRPQDIRADNTVLSTFVADAAIEYSGQGVLASAERPGLITRVMNWLF